jgi:cytochrome c-type biogenesis protein CcmH/NrfG
MKKYCLVLFLIPLLSFSQTNFEKAEKLFYQEKYALAKPLFENELKDSPNHLKSIEHLGDISVQLNNLDKAIYYYQMLMKLKPNEANFYYKYGGALGLKSQAGGKWVAIRLIGDMKDAFEKAISLKPNHLEARWALIEYYLQVPGLFGGSEKKAQIYANQLMTFSSVDGYLARGKIDEYFERFKSAEKNYLKAIQISGFKTTYDRLTALNKVKLLQSVKAIKILDEYQEKIKS